MGFMVNIAPKGEKTLESDQLSCGGRHRCFILLLWKTRKHLSFLDFNLSLKLAVQCFSFFCGVNIEEFSQGWENDHGICPSTKQ
jgi:hypothetical protein